VSEQSPSQGSGVESAELQRTPFYDFHLKSGAKMANFGGWVMPIEYPAPSSGVLAEHQSVRERVGLFDVSHLGKLRVAGEGALEFLNQVLSNDLSQITDGQCQYNLILNDDGGIVDDLIVYRISPSNLFLIPNAANCHVVLNALQRELAKKQMASVTIEDCHQSYVVIALQGPLSQELIKSVSAQTPELAFLVESIGSELPYMSFQTLKWQNSELFLCRTGYTGELGYELVVEINESGREVEKLWQTLSDSLVQFDGRVVGLGARDTLRTEMGYPLHGQDLSLEINPLEAGLGWAISFKKYQSGAGDFIGREALLKVKAEGVKRKSFGLKALERAIPRTGMNVYQRGAEKAVGVITSGTFSPSLKEGIALALLPPTTQIGDKYLVDIRGRLSEFEVVKPPFLPTKVRSK
jgi:aminomethyltransferase